MASKSTNPRENRGFVSSLSLCRADLLGTIFAGRHLVVVRPPAGGRGARSGESQFHDEGRNALAATGVQDTVGAVENNTRPFL